MTKPSTTATQRSLREVIADDSHALTFQTSAQYRAALLKHEPVEHAHHAEAFAWAVFAKYDNVIIWSKNRAQIESASKKYGRPIVPVIALFAAEQGAAPVPPTHCDPAEGFCAKCREQERAALANQPAPTVPADALRKLCDQLDGMKRRMRHTPGTGQHHSYLMHEDVEAYVEQARAALAHQPAQEQAEPVDGDMLPPVGAKVLIHLGRQDAWVEHTVTGYYVWPACKHQVKDGEKDAHRVFVRVKDAQGYDNARLLSEVKVVGQAAQQEPAKEQAEPVGALNEHLDAFEAAMLKKGYPQEWFNGFHAEGQFTFYEKTANCMFDAWQAAQQEPVAAPQQAAAPGVLDDLDFTPDAHYQVADMANVGYELMQAIKVMRPDYCWNDTPAEIVSDLINELDEATTSAPVTPEARKGGVA